MYAFEFHHPSNVNEAAALLAKSQGKLVAGGQSLVAAMKLRLANPGVLVDLSGIAELRGIKSDGKALVIGATTRHAQVAESRDVKEVIPALARYATWAPSAARSPTTTRRRAIRQRCWVSGRRCAPTSAPLPQTISSKVCTRRRCKTTKSSPR